MLVIGPNGLLHGRHRVVACQVKEKIDDAEIGLHVISLTHLLPSPSSTTTLAVERYGRCCSLALVIDDLHSTVGAILKPNIVGPLAAAFLANERVVVAHDVASERRVNQVGKATHDATPTRIISACNPGERALQALAIQRVVCLTSQFAGDCPSIIRRQW